MAEFRQKLRGSTADLDGVALYEGLLAVDLTRQELRLYDGIALGGYRIPNLTTLQDDFVPAATGGQFDGRISSTGNIVAGQGAGGPALTEGEASGDANVGFNYEAGLPQQTGNSAQISVNKDSTTAAEMDFKLAANNSIATPLALNSVLTLKEDRVDVAPPVYAPGNDVADHESKVINRTAGDARYAKADGSNLTAILAAVIDHLFAIGDTIITDNSSNPATRFPGTTWALVSTGRAVVGVGGNGQSNWTVGQVRGSETHQLTTHELASHTHTGTTGNQSANHTHSGTTGSENTGHTHRTDNANNSFVVNTPQNTQNVFESGNGGGLAIASGSTSDRSNTHQHPFTTGGVSNNHQHPFTTNSNGGNGAHNNVQPSRAFYIWQRTA